LTYLCVSLHKCLYFCWWVNFWWLVFHFVKVKIRKYSWLIEMEARVYGGTCPVLKFKLRFCKVRIKLLSGKLWHVNKSWMLRCWKVRLGVLEVFGKLWQGHDTGFKITILMFHCNFITSFSDIMPIPSFTILEIYSFLFFLQF
jgi:hypothetical protein